MLKKVLIVFNIMMIFAFSKNIFSEEPSLRETYKDSFEKLGEVAKLIHYEEGKERQGHIGLGISGNFLFEIKSWDPSTLRYGFVDLDLTFCLAPSLNIVIGGGYHNTNVRSIIPVYGMLQLLSPEMRQLEKEPVSVGIELGVVYYGSSINEESVTSFKLGICRYQFFTKRLALTTNIDWITPSFRDNNFEFKFGFKYFL